MVEVIIDTNADIDVLLRELQRLSKSLKSSSSSSGRCVLTWGYVCADTTLQELFQERLSSVMGAAKSQRTVHFPRERLILGSHAETEIELLAPHLRILPESAIQSRSRQEERKAAFKEAKTKALEEHREKMLRLVMQGIEMPRAAAPSAVAADVKSSGDESGSEDGD
ncbi:hypothetical protein DQ04_14421010, partial [Trypanosoma grayi]|uniref:hypothetical protein n=1 Tax=Trypanosoma grayi TaxID=71804 RepID=UPI0004F46465